MATFLRQSDCGGGGDPDANPNRLRDPDAISRSVKSNKIFTQVLDPDGKVSHMKVYFIFNEDKNCRKEGRLTPLKHKPGPACIPCAPYLDYRHKYFELDIRNLDRWLRTPRPQAFAAYLDENPRAKPMIIHQTRAFSTFIPPFLAADSVRY